MKNLKNTQILFQEKRHSQSSSKILGVVLVGKALHLITENRNIIWRGVTSIARMMMMNHSWFE